MLSKSAYFIQETYLTMKKLIFLFLFISVSFAKPVFAQQDPNRILIEEYIRQSEKQRKTGLIMLGTGIGASILGTAMFGAAWGGASEFVGVTGVTLMLTGTISTLVSIPVIVSSGLKGRKAGKLSLITAQIPQLGPLSNSAGYYSALSFSIPLSQNR